jgi:hypothetical protein
MSDLTSKLSPAGWRAHLRALLAECDASAAIEQAERIRQAWELFAAAPQPQAGLPPHDTIEAMLDADACESAALALVGPERGFLLSRGGNGMAIASIVLPDADEDHTASGATPALALLAALALALLGDDSAKSPRDRLGGAPAPARLN